MATPAGLPALATPYSSALTKFGTYIPDTIPQLQQAFYLGYRTDVYVTSAQLLAIKDTPILLIPAPGTGLMLVPESVLFRMIGGTQYTDAGGAMSVSVGTFSAALAANTIVTGPSAAGYRSQQIFPITAISTAAGPPTNENAACYLTKITNNYAAGTGTLHVTVFYSIETTT
jgi:hypothetical protein